MERLLEQADHIISMLQQIKGITLNQQTIILQKSKDTEENKMIEEMSSYKNNLMMEVEVIEQQFEERFKKEKLAISEHEEIQVLKGKVIYILKLKEEIVLGEQRNLLLFEDQFKKQINKIELPKNPKQVARAYEQHNKKQ